MEIEFNGKVVLVSGGSRGIGRAICEKFAGSGASVVINYRENRKAAEKTLEALNGDDHSAVKCDISKPGQISEMVDKVIDEYGKIDILVNNAGIYEEIDVAGSKTVDWFDHWDRTIGINLMGAVNLTYYVTKYMLKEENGKVVNITSRGAFRGEPSAPAYGAAKAGLNSFSQSMAKAFAPYGVYFYAVAPGYVETAMTTDILNTKRGDIIRAQSPLNRVAKAEEVANTVFLLASEGTEFMTGCIVDINGASYLRT